MSDYLEILEKYQDIKEITDLKDGSCGSIIIADSVIKCSSIFNL